MEKYGLLFESIFKRKLTDEDTVSYLERVTKEHPYFSVAQFYLLRLSQKNVNGYKVQARKTAVLFNNNHWLNFQLLEAGFDTTAAVPDETLPQSFPEKIADEIVVKENETKEEESLSVSFDTPPRFQTIEEEAASVSEKAIQEEIKEEESGVTEPVVINEPITTSDNNTVEEVIVAEVNEEVSEQVEPVQEDDATTIEEVVVDEPETTEATIATSQAAHIEITNDSTGEIVDTDAAADENPIAGRLSEITDEPVVKLEEPITEEIIPAIEEAPKVPIIDIGTAPVPASEPLSESMLFEPLHTTDYFASVGIKLSEEEKTSGNLGKQLKSFTEWLKTMKKVHAEQLAKTTAPDSSLSASESSIQKMAEKSNQENDVITEAMSDVLLQQGKADKAIEILEKLSLLNPGKSVYFAAKINQIKEK